MKDTQNISLWPSLSGFSSSISNSAGGTSSTLSDFYMHSPSSYNRENVPSITNLSNLLINHWDILHYCCHTTHPYCLNCRMPLGDPDGTWSELSTFNLYADPIVPFMCLCVSVCVFLFSTPFNERKKILC